MLELADEIPIGHEPNNIRLRRTRQSSSLVQIDPSVAEDYTRLLEAVFLVHRLPAFGGLRILLRRLGDRCIGTTVLYLGQHACTLQERIHVVPLSRLWS